MKSTIRNESIDIMRYVCAILVVAIHTSPFSEINIELGYFFTEILPRIAVPYFFAVSGYYYVKKLDKGQKCFRTYIKRLLITYIVWSVPYFVIDFIQWGHLNIKGYLFNCISNFCITGSMYHFWFFPAIIFSVCVVTLLYKMKYNRFLIPASIFLYIIGCLGCSYYKPLVYNF